jgi:hypothetical protein
MENAKLVAIVRNKFNPSDIFPVELITQRDEEQAGIVITFRKKSWRRLGVRLFFGIDKWHEVGTIDDSVAGTVAVCTETDAPQIIMELNTRKMPNVSFFGLKSLFNHRT